MIIPVPIRDLQLGQWVLLEDVGLVEITTLTFHAESVDIDFDGTQSPLARRVDRPVYGVWSGRFDDFPVIDVYHHEESHHG